MTSGHFHSCSGIKSNRSLGFKRPLATQLPVKTACTWVSWGDRRRGLPPGLRAPIDLYPQAPSRRWKEHLHGREIAPSSLPIHHSPRPFMLRRNRQTSNKSSTQQRRAHGCQEFGTPKCTRSLSHQKCKARGQQTSGPEVCRGISTTGSEQPEGGQEGLPSHHGPAPSELPDASKSQPRPRQEPPALGSHAQS